MCPYTVFNITPTKWGHVRQEHMKHIGAFHFALFPVGSQSGLHTGFEKKRNLSRVSQESPVQYNLMSYSNNHTEKKMLGACLSFTPG